MTRRAVAAGLTVALLLLANRADAARVRFHYGADWNPSCPPSVPGERISMFGSVREPYNRPLPRPPLYITYRHPYTGRAVTVPVALPEGTPRIEHRGRRIVYNYGSYAVEVDFLPDGSTDVIYNPGPLRCP